MLTARALPVAGTGDDEVVPPAVLVLDAALGEVLVDRLEDVLAVDGDVGAVLEPGAGGHDVVGGDLVPHLDGHIAVQILLQRRIGRRSADVRATEDLHPTAVGGREDQHRVVDREGGGLRDLGVRDAMGRERIGEDTRDGRQGGGLRADEVDVGALGAAAPLEVAVARPQAHPVGTGALVVADAEAAGALEDPRPALHERGQRAIPAEHEQHLPAPRCDAKADVGRHRMTGEDVRHLLQVHIAGVGARADEDLVDAFARQVPHHLDVARRVGAGHLRLKRGEIDLKEPVVDGPLVGRKRPVDLRTPLGLEVISRILVTGEEGGGHPTLGPHVADGGPLGDLERRHSLPGVLEDAVDVALGAEVLQDREDHILGADPRAQRPAEADLDDSRTDEVEGTAGHGDGHIEAPRPDGDHGEASAGGGVAVAAEKGLARLAEALQVHLVADSVARLGEDHPLGRGDALQVAVVVGVLEADLDGIVVHVADGQLILHPLKSHRLELQVGHRTGGVLGKGLVDGDADRLAALQRPALQVGAQDFLRQCLCHG